MQFEFIGHVFCTCLNYMVQKVTGHLFALVHVANTVRLFESEKKSYERKLSCINVFVTHTLKSSV